MTGALTIVDNPQTDSSDGVLSARSGDFGAFEELYRQNVGRVLGLCLRLTGDRERAEDLTQETFLLAWRKLDSFRGEGSFGAWIRRVAVHAVLGDRRSRRRIREDAIGDREDALTHPRLDRPDGRVDLERAVAALPDGARAVFVLHDIEGYLHDEISSLLGIAAGTSRTQLHRARRLLRETLQT